MLNHDELIKKARVIFEKYGYKNTNEHEASLELEHSRLKISFYLRGYRGQDEVIEVEVRGTIIKKSKYCDYDLGLRKDVANLCTRIRNLAKKANENEAELKRSVDKGIDHYRKIAMQLEEQRIAFSLNIRKAKYTDRAIITINGRDLHINRNLMVNLEISTKTERIHVTKAIELANLLPALK